MFKKGTDIVVSLGDDGAIVSSFSSGKLQKRIFVTSPLSTDFIEMAKTMPEAKIYLLLDTIDQNYIFSNIPSVGKSNVGKIIKRKITTEFDQNDLNAALFLSKETTTAKKQQRYLFVSVRNGPPFKDWMDAIYQLPNRVEGIYLVPVEAEEFIGKLRKVTHGEKKQDEWEVLISYNRVGGFRQIVLRNGKLIFTRISQSVSLQTPDAVGRNISQEAANTLEYIRRIGFYDQTISIYVICSKDAAGYIEVPGVKPKDVFIYNPFDLAQKLNLAHSAQDSDKFGDVLFAANFIENKKKILKLTTKEIKANEKLYLYSLMITFVSYLLMCVMPLAAAYQIYQAITVSSKIAQNEKQLKQKNGELASVKNFEKEYGIKPEVLIDVVKAKNTFSERDRVYNYILQKYKEADTFSNYLSYIKFSEDKNGKKSVDIKAVFDYSAVKNYGDVLYQIEQYTTNVKAALVDYDVEFMGLPNEKDIKVDFEKNAVKQDKTEVSVNITVK